MGAGIGPMPGSEVITGFRQTTAPSSAPPLGRPVHSRTGGGQVGEVFGDVPGQRVQVQVSVPELRPPSGRGRDPLHPRRHVGDAAGRLRDHRRERAPPGGAQRGQVGPPGQHRLRRRQRPAKTFHTSGNTPRPARSAGAAPGWRRSPPRRGGSPPGAARAGSGPAAAAESGRRPHRRGRARPRRSRRTCSCR